MSTNLPLKSRALAAWHRTPTIGNIEHPIADLTQITEYITDRGIATYVELHSATKPLALYRLRSNGSLMRVWTIHYPVAATANGGAS